ncbi:MAG: START domain-containing protein [Flavobacteriaceae bacterium]
MLGIRILEMKKLVLYVLFVVCSFVGHSQTNWELKKEDSGIQVYTRSIPSSTIKEYKATMVVNSTIEIVVEKIMTPNELKYWNYKITESKLLKKISSNELIIYMYNDFPWPIKDRDHISQLTLEQLNALTYKINIASLPNYLSLHHSAIRIDKFSGFWLIENTAKGVKITQQMHGEPKGHLPSAIINSTLTRAPFQTFKNLKHILTN